METFKQLMAFPLYITVIWLLWVLARASPARTLWHSADRPVLLSLMLLAPAFSAWPGADAGACAIACLDWRGGVLAHPDDAQQALGRLTQIGSTARMRIPEDRLAQLRRAASHGSSWNFTADWCLTCNVNEKSRGSAVQSVREAFREASRCGTGGRLDAAQIRAITAALARFGPRGCAPYLVYRARRRSEVFAADSHLAKF